MCVYFSAICLARCRDRHLYPRLLRVRRLPRSHPSCVLRVRHQRARRPGQLRSAPARAAPSAITPLWTTLGAARDRDEPRFKQRPHREENAITAFLTRHGTIPSPPRRWSKRGPQLSRTIVGTMLRARWSRGAACQLRCSSRNPPRFRDIFQLSSGLKWHGHGWNTREGPSPAM